MVTTKAPCVLVLKADVLMKRAFASLITQGGEFEVAVSEALDLTDLIEDVASINPDAIFLSGSLPLADKASLSQLLIRYRGLKVVVVSNESNWLHIFKREDRLLTRLDDLLLVINST